MYGYVGTQQLCETITCSRRVIIPCTIIIIIVIIIYYFSLPFQHLTYPNNCSVFFSWFFPRWTKRPLMQSSVPLVQSTKATLNFTRYPRHAEQKSLNYSSPSVPSVVNIYYLLCNFLLNTAHMFSCIHLLRELFVFYLQIYL